MLRVGICWFIGINDSSASICIKDGEKLSFIRIKLKIVVLL